VTGESQNTGKKLFQAHSVDHKSHMDWHGTKLGSLWRQTSDFNSKCVPGISGCYDMI